MSEETKPAEKTVEEQLAAVKRENEALRQANQGLANGNKMLEASVRVLAKMLP